VDAQQAPGASLLPEQVQTVFVHILGCCHAMFTFWQCSLAAMVAAAALLLLLLVLLLALLLKPKDTAAAD